MDTRIVFVLILYSIFAVVSCKDSEKTLFV